MLEGFTSSEIAAYQERRLLLDRAAAIPGSLETKARAIGTTSSKLWRLQRMAARAQAEKNPRLLVPGKSSGRKPSVKLEQAEADHMRKVYIKSNLREGAGSMTYAARSAALDPDSPLKPETRRAILKPRASKHSLPVPVRRACRAMDSTVSIYRDPRELNLNGIYAPGSMRTVRDAEGNLRRLRPGERWSCDDASINFMVCVPWPWGGDPCSEKFGVRVGRYQLLACIDDATDFCTGFSYVMRGRDSYRADDVVSMLAGNMRLGYLPAELVVEGGAWQSDRALEFLRLSGVKPLDAKGRPRMKLIESWFNRLWTPLSEKSSGQIGRFRGEMKRENDILMQCRRGTLDPRRAFPMLEVALDAVQWGVAYLNQEPVESREYGRWIPQEAHASGLAAAPRPRLEADLSYLAARERHERTIRRGGMVCASALSPLGEIRPYTFAGDQLQPFDGAKVWVHFDPFEAPVRATVSLAAPFRDHPAGKIIASTLHCINAAPEVLRDELSGHWQIRFADGIAEAARAKRLAAAAVRRELRATGLDGRRVAAESTISAPEGALAASAIVPAASSWTDDLSERLKEAEQYETAERQAGRLAS
jgi:hypothetical protein